MEQHPAVTAAADQAAAAAGAIGRQVLGGLVEWVPPLAGCISQLNRVTARLAAGELNGCPEAVTATTGPEPARTRRRPRALIWLAWHPNVISCPACALRLPAAPPDHCDGCGRAGPAGQVLNSATYVLPPTAEHAARSGRLIPPLICTFIVCRRCSQASRSEPVA
jgi:hypothetical protein